MSKKDDREIPDLTHSEAVDTDRTPPEGPGGPDSMPDWEAADPEPATPDQPLAAQVDDDTVPDEIQEREDTDDGEDEGEQEDQGDPGQAD